MELLKEKYNGAINAVTIGRTREDGGGRTLSVTVGGETTMPFLFQEGRMPNPPAIAFELPDEAGEEAVVLLAKKYVEEDKAQLLSLSLKSTHPDFGDVKPDSAVRMVRKILDAVGVPLIITGSGNNDKDNLVLPAVCEAAKGQRALIGSAAQDNYKTLTAACLADGHAIIASSPIDINIAKQVNILISDMGLDPKNIVMHPSTAALGYGMEYVYSIIERSRLAAFSGDKMMAMPIILFVGEECWRVKEAKELGEETGIMWETHTATTMLLAGADILVMRHPKAIENVRKTIDVLMKG